MTEIKIWGIKVTPLSKKQVVELIEYHIDNISGLFHLTGVNPETIAQAQDNSELCRAINSSDVVNIDNMLVVTSLRLLGYKIPERAASPDIFELLLELINRKGYSVYFLGAKENVLRKMLRKLKEQYPDMNITGARNGYFEPDEEPSVVAEINQLSPDLLFIALPTPQKELFILRNKMSLNTRFAYGVGGAFDVLAGVIKRAPLWMRNIGLEGIHRSLQNPSTYMPRYYKYYLPFMKLFFRELFHKKRFKS